MPTGFLVGLTRSEKTSVMTTPKRPGTHIWQICLADLPTHQSSIDALNTITPNLADLPPIKHRFLEYRYTKHGRSTPLSIEYRCLEYPYTKLGRSIPPSIKHRCLEYCYTKLGRSTPQSSIDVLNTITPNMADLLADLPPCQSSIDALNTTTPNLAYLLVYLTPINWP